NKIKCHQINFTYDDIKDCDEAFVTGTFAGIIPVSELENRKLKSIHPDSAVNHIRLLYNNHIKKNIS
ncbi:MAG: hypothetical protein HOA86_00130, partial [Gammaproteobacteria bacterium]|nr:hypothetical protein [Gammaproteobacteria bacterium]